MEEAGLVQIDKAQLSLALFEICESGSLQDLEQLLEQVSEAYRGDWMWNLRDKATADTLLHAAITHRYDLSVGLAKCESLVCLRRC